MQGIHNDGPNRHRMPLFLTPELEQAWISEITEDDMTEIFNFELPEDGLFFQPVYSLRGGAIRPDGKHKFDYWDWEGLPPLGDDNPRELQRSLF
ncbi:hypothetical protein SAMN05216436_1377 [bacterium A37T11]|nr:hypothetical protein SAMN05216436_1377 [bacterium A37T11]